MVHRMNEGKSVCAESIEKCAEQLRTGYKCQKCLYAGVIVPAALHGPDACGMKSAERWIVNFVT